MRHIGPNHKDGCDGTTFTMSGEGYNRVRVCACGAEDHAPDSQSLRGLRSIAHKAARDMDKNSMDSQDEITHGLVIFGRLVPRGSGSRQVSAEHDVIYAGPNPSTVTERDLIRLAELGWRPDSEHECFYYFT